MFNRIWQWQHWGVVRYVSGLLTAVATTTTVCFGIWTYYDARESAAIIETQDQVVFEIVADSGSVGVTLETIREIYAEQMAAHGPSQAPDTLEEDDILSTLLRLTPNVTLVADKWHVSNRAPVSNVKVFIQDIALGIPRIPDSYKSQFLRDDDVVELLTPLAESGEVLRLSEEEARRLNEIATVFSEPTQLASSEQTYSMRDVVRFVGGSFASYYDYTLWERAARQWGTLLSGDSEPEESADQRIEALVNTQFLYAPDSSGLFRAMIELAADSQDERALSLVADDDDCLPANSARIRLVRGPEMHIIDWGLLSLPIFRRGAPREMVDTAEKLVRLFDMACVKSLSRILLRASRIFGTQYERMEQYIDEWNGILTGRRANSVTLRVTISNFGPFDTYVRSSIRVGVGTIGSDAKILFTLTADKGSDEDSETNPYLPIGARTPSTYVFRSSLAPEISEKLYGAFTSGLSYIQAGIVASSGGPNENVFSPVTPFSDRARELLREEVDGVRIDF